MTLSLLAHVKWYVDDPADAVPDAAFTTSPATLAMLAGAIGVAVAWRLVARRLPVPELAVLRPLGRLAP